MYIKTYCISTKIDMQIVQWHHRFLNWLIMECCCTISLVIKKEEKNRQQNNNNKLAADIQYFIVSILGCGQWPLLF